MLEQYSDAVLDDIDTIVDMNFAKLGLIRKPASQTVVGLCTDGVIAGVVTVGLNGKPNAIVTLQIHENAMQALANSALLEYFLRNRQHVHQTMAEYCLGMVEADVARPRVSN